MCSVMYVHICLEHSSRCCNITILTKAGVTIQTIAGVIFTMNNLCSASFTDDLKSSVIHMKTFLLEDKWLLQNSRSILWSNKSLLEYLKVNVNVLTFYYVEIDLLWKSTSQCILCLECDLQNPGMGIKCYSCLWVQ